MAFSSWRGVVGMINPTMRPGVTEVVIRLLPQGIGLIPLFLDFRRGTTDEFKAAMPAYERNVAILAEHACDLIHPVGAPPFMVLGRAAGARPHHAGGIHGDVPRSGIHPGGRDAGPRLESY